MNIAGEIQKTFSRTPKMRQVAVAQRVPCSDSGVSGAAPGRVQKTGRQGVFTAPLMSPLAADGWEEQQVRNNVA